MQARSYDYWFILSFLALSIAQLWLVAASPLTLSPDESYYWQWSKHLDYCYHSKGPLVAILIAIGTGLLGDTELGVRLPAIVCYGSFTLLFYLFLRARLGAQIAFFSWLILRSSLAFAQAGFVMTTDAPYLLFWMLCLWALYVAVIVKRHAAWVVFGLGLGLGLWAKYTVVLLVPGVLLYLWRIGELRQHITSKYAWVGVLVFAAFLFPILWWNFEHGWVNMSHNAAHLGKSSGIRFKYLPELFIGQFFLVGPLLFLGMLLGVRRVLRDDEDNSFVRLLLWSALPLLFVIVCTSLTRRVYANWPLALYVNGLILLAVLFEGTQLRETLRKFYPAALLLNAVLFCAAHAPLLGVTFGVPGDLLPTKKLYGWDILAERVQKEFQGSDESTFLLTDSYGVASALTFHLPNHPYVYVANIGARRFIQHDIWTKDWSTLRGRSALIVIKDDAEVEKLHARFASLQPVEAEGITHLEYSGKRIKRFTLYRGSDFNGDNLSVD